MSKTRSALRTNVRTILDEVSAADWSDAQINTELNWVYMEMYTAVVEVYEDYYRTNKTSSIVANQQEYALPDDFFKIRRLEIKYVSTDERVKANPFKFDQLSRSITSTSYGSLSRPAYELSGDYIRVLPIPDTTVASAMLMTYIKQESEMDDDADTVNIPFADRYAKYLIKGACAQLLSKGQQEESVATKYEAYFQYGLEKMKQELEERYADGPKMIQDTLGQSRNFTSTRGSTGYIN